MRMHFAARDFFPQAHLWWQSNLSFWASGSGSLDVLLSVSWFLVDIKGNVYRLFVRGWFVHDGGKELIIVSAAGSYF